MVSEHKSLFDSNDVVVILRIVVSKMCQHIYLNISLIIEFLLVSNYLQSHILFSLMIKAFQSLPKTSFSQRRDHFKSVPYMILQNNVIVSPLIVIPIVKFIPNCRIYFLSVRTYKVNFFKIKNFSLLVISQNSLKSSNSGPWFQRE